MTTDHALRYDRGIEPGGQDSLSVIARMIPPDSTVLDLGAATGALGRALSTTNSFKVDGVEIDAAAASQARPHYRNLVAIDLEKVPLAPHFPAGAYDVIICADVLEHLRDPGKVLDQLKPLLAPGGKVIVSIPNVGYVGVVGGILTGEFKYRPSGLLDQAHLRFFTRRSLLDLLAQHGFGALHIRAVVLEPHQTEFSTTAFERLQPALLEALLAAPDALAYQFIVEAAPGEHAPKIVELLQRPELQFGVQLYWAASGEEFDERKSSAVSLPMTPGLQTATLALPQQSGLIARVRLDVADRPGFLHISGLKVTSHSGAPLWSWDGNPASLPVRHDLLAFEGPSGETWLATGPDPYLELPLPAAVMEGLAGSAVEVKLGWPASADYALAISAIHEQDGRTMAERRVMNQRIAALEERAVLSAQRAEALVSEAALRVEARFADLSRQAAHLAQDGNALRGLAHRLTLLENAPGIRPLLRTARRTLLRQNFVLEAVPRKELRASDAGGWESTGVDSSFELTSNRNRFPTGWVRLRIELDSDGPFVTPPQLYVDSGEGYTEGSCILLPRPKDGVIQTLVKFPTRARSMRFDPTDRPGRFRLGAIQAQEMGKAEAAARLAAPLAREILTEPGRLKLAVRKAWMTLREGGVSGLKERLRERTRVNDGYDEWIAQFDTLSPRDEAAIRARVEALPNKPVFSVVMPVYQTPEKWLRWAIESVRKQLYPHWELCIADDASKAAHVRAVLEEYAKLDPRIKVAFRPLNGHISESSNTALSLATGDFAVLLDHDDELPAHALYLLAEELNAHPDTDLIYSDEDKIDETGRRYEPYFKPEWDFDLFCSQNYFSHLGVYRLSLVREVGGFRKGYEGSQDYDLALRCVARTDRVRHLPYVLYHWRSIPGSTAASADAKDYATDAGQRALRDHFRARDPRIQVEAGPWPTNYRVRYPLPAKPPLASLLIPTRNGLEVLRRCIESVHEKTRYPAFEIIIVDNDSRDPGTLQYLEELQATHRARIVRYPHQFNYSAINNLAAREASGEVLVLLNNDVEVIAPGWLEELVVQALRPGVGAVGAKLLYPNDTIQHSGVITGLYGIAGHIHRHLPRESPGHFGRAGLLQRMTVVTGACLAVRKSVYQTVGGLDEQHLAVAFNDVDFCLRLIEAGYRNLYTPYAELYHHESYSRGVENTPEKKARFAGEIEYMEKRWAKVLAADPCYNPNLSLFSESFALAWPPRNAQPWKVD